MDHPATHGFARGILGSGALTGAQGLRFAEGHPMRGRTVRRVVALLSTIACCIALPAHVCAATDDSTSKPPAKSTKSTAKPSSTSKKPSTKSSSKPSSKSSSKSTKSSSKASASHSSAKKPSKATTSAKKPSTAPVATKPPPTSDAVRAAFDPAAPTSTGIPGAPAATASATPAGQRGPTRIDFDDRLIQGQRNTAGAVYLYDRKELKQRSMIKKRESFREEIVGVVYDSEL
jgi:hypothetical protein